MIGSIQNSLAFAMLDQCSTQRPRTVSVKPEQFLGDSGDSVSDLRVTSAPNGPVGPATERRYQSCPIGSRSSQIGALPGGPSILPSEYQEPFSIKYTPSLKA